MATPEAPATTQFDAFISYSREDIEFARKLEKALNAYKPPREIKAPQRNLRVFRDEIDLTGVEYYQSIEQHLQNAAKLIVLCSPAARQSDYVNDEIRRFAKNKGPEHIIPILVAGVPNNEASLGQEADLAFPEALVEALSLPLAISYLNFNPQRDRVNQGTFANSWHTLLANIYDISRAEIERREQKRKIRRLYTALTVIGSIMLLLAGLTVFAFMQRSTAINQANVALSRYLAIESDKQSNVQVDLSLLLAVEGVTLEPSPEARDTLHRVVEKHYHLSSFLHGQKGSVITIAFSPDGLTLATGSSNHAIILWNVANRQPLGEPLTGHVAPVTSLAFSPDGRTLASGSQDGTLILWDLDSKQALGPAWFGHKDLVHRLAFSPDGRTLVSGSEDETIILWDVEQKMSLGLLFMSGMGGVTSVAFNHSGQILASGSRNGPIILWDVAKRRPMGKYLDGHTRYVYGLVFSQDDRTLISGSHDNKIILWDVATRRQINEPSLTSFIFGPQALSPDGTKWAYIQGENITVFDSEKGESYNFWYGPTDRIISFSFSPDNQMLGSGDARGTIMLWDLETRQVPVPIQFSTVGASPPRVAFSPDGRMLAFGAKNGSIIFYDINSRKALAPPSEHNYDITELVFSQDAKTFASGDSDGTITLWDVGKKATLGKLMIGQGGYGGRYRPDFSPSGKIILVKEGEPGVNRLAFSPDGKSLAADYFNTIILVDVERKHVVGKLFEHPGGISAMAFSPDGSKLASGGVDSTIILWDVEKRQPIGNPLLGHQGRVMSLAFSPKGTTLASSSIDQTVTLWDVEKKQSIVNLFGEEVTRLVFSPDGLTLATSGKDQRVSLWDMEGLRNVGEYTAGEVIAFSPDGKIMASYTWPNQTVILWDLDVQSWIKRACRKANRNLTKWEWRRYIGDLPYRQTCPDLPGPEENQGASSPVPTR
jgi:WD40 repeat protein